VGTHLHHILPKHAGGTDDPSNLFPLSITQHALAHRNRAILIGDAEDWIAWKTLSGQIASEEATRIAQDLGRRRTNRKGTNNGMWGKTHSSKIRRILASCAKDRFTGKELSEDHKEKLSVSNRGKHNHIGVNNPNFKHGKYTKVCSNG